MAPDREEYAAQEAELDELYREIILDHYRSPHNKGALPSPSTSHEGFNPLCGDEVRIDLAIRGDRIEEVRFQGRGCSISQASASMLTDAIKGLNLREATALFKAFQSMMLGDDSIDPDELGDLGALMGVRKFPVRVKCATLAWHTLDEAIKEYRASRR